MTANRTIVLALVLLLCGCQPAPPPSVGHTSSVNIGSGGGYLTCEAPRDSSNRRFLCVPSEPWMQDYAIIHMPERGCPAGWRLLIGVFERTVEPRHSFAERSEEGDYAGHDATVRSHGCANPDPQPRYYLDQLATEEVLHSEKRQ